MEMPSNVGGPKQPDALGPLRRARHTEGSQRAQGPVHTARGQRPDQVDLSYGARVRELAKALQAEPEIRAEVVERAQSYRDSEPIPSQALDRLAAILTRGLSAGTPEMADEADSGEGSEGPANANSAT